MSNIKVTLPNNSVLEMVPGSTILDAVKKIGPGLAKSAIAAYYNDKEMDLSRTLTEDGALRVLTHQNSESLEIVRHSTAHLMAMAVTELFPGTLLTIGPVIENGFYYDFDSKHKFSPEDFPAIEAKMKDLAKMEFTVERSVMPRLDAIAHFKDPAHLEPYKVEMMDEWTDDTVSFYKQGPFTDLCRGPHVPNTSKLQHFKLLSVAGAYWRGDEKRPMLQRIYATAFLTKDDLEKHLFQLEEAKKRDHRKLGKELDYFHLEEGSPGMVFWHPRGWRLYTTLMGYLRAKISRRGYQEVRTPEIVERNLFVLSGHIANYSHNMFFTESENREYAIKPMNCPCHVEIFKQGIKSFRDLPIRMAEFGKCHRNELAGAMHGLMRVRGFTQDDAHIFCTVDQIADEVADFCKLLQEVYTDFGFTQILVKLADRPEKRVGGDAFWDKAEEALREACRRADLEYSMNPGDGAFYGPKLEFTLLDSLGRHWQCGTIQVDYFTAGSLGGEYVASDGSKVPPVMLHRAVFGSLERFIGILIENFAGDLPLWINPQQIRILPVSEKFLKESQELNEKFLDAGFYSEVDARNDKIGFKIREGEREKVPYLVILGDKEIQSGKISLRKRKTGDLGAFSLDEALEKFKFEISSKGA
ncbi:MAG: threonine--tRNA ligase [Fibrobacteria bacterium]